MLRDKTEVLTILGWSLYDWKPIFGVILLGFGCRESFWGCEGVEEPRQPENDFDTNCAIVLYRQCAVLPIGGMT